MNGTYLLIVLIIILAVSVFYHHADYFKKLYQDIVSPKGWKRIEIVEEKSTLDEIFSADLPCGMVELLSGAAACVVCFLMGWRLRHFHNYEKCSECLKKQNVIEEKVKTLQDKIDDFHKRYSVLTTELIYSSASNEIELPLTKDAFQQMDTEGIDRSSQTSGPTHLLATQVEIEPLEQESDAGCCHRSLEIEQDSVTEVNSKLTLYVDSDEYPYKYPTVLCSERNNSDNCLCNENNTEKYSPNPITQEQNKFIDMSKTQTAKTVVNESETYPEEIDFVTCPSTDDGESCKFQIEQEKSLRTDKVSKQNVTVLDVVEPVSLPVGGGECDEPQPCKPVNLKGRIPQYQRLRKGSDQKPKTAHEPEGADEDIAFTAVPVLQTKATEHFATEVTKSRIVTPRAYSLASSELAENPSTSGTSRRRKQRNYNVK